MMMVSKIDVTVRSSVAGSFDMNVSKTGIRRKVGIAFTRSFLLCSGVCPDLGKCISGLPDGMETTRAGEW